MISIEEMAKEAKDARRDKERLLDIMPETMATAVQYVFATEKRYKRLMPSAKKFGTEWEQLTRTGHTVFGAYTTEIKELFTEAYRQMPQHSTGQMRDINTMIDEMLAQQAAITTRYPQQERAEDIAQAVAEARCRRGL